MTVESLPQNEAFGKSVLDSLREMDASEAVRFLGEAVVNMLMSSEADAICGAPYGVRDPEGRANSRNGYRDRRLDTTAGTLELKDTRAQAGHMLSGVVSEPIPAKRRRPLGCRGGDMRQRGVDQEGGQGHKGARRGGHVVLAGVEGLRGA